jgi:hypothetical protein
MVGSGPRTFSAWEISDGSRAVCPFVLSEFDRGLPKICPAYRTRKKTIRSNVILQQLVLHASLRHALAIHAHHSNQASSVT